MDNEKPFKTIEAVDSRTNQICKIACMSCIRGHRTTSCGIPVCRTKIFWTVKRPGRPSNSCTCRYGTTGGCKCVVARAACPHKSKKGEKRSGECRCDESGRYCCLLEPEHWTALLSLQKPTVEFFATREDLEARQATTTPAPMPLTPSDSSITSPRSTNGIPITPVPQGRMPHVPIMPNTYNAYSPMSTTLTPTLAPRFGMMGIGAPVDSHHHVPPELLAWQGQAPPVSRDFHPFYSPIQSEQNSCCQVSSPSAQSLQSPIEAYPLPYDRQNAVIPHQHDEPGTVTLSQLSPAPFDFDKLRMNYLQHQFPGSICQNCGLAGCTCRNCPPVFQNFGTTSWAQCCGRKHARDVQPAPAPQKIPRTEKYEPAQGLCSQPRVHDPSPLLQDAFAQQVPANSGNPFHGTEGYSETLLPPPGTGEFGEFDGFGHGLAMMDSAEQLDISEFLIPDLEQGHPGLETGGGGGDGREGEDRGGGDGGGACCCSGS